MSRLLLLAMLLASFNSAADSIYRTTDAEGNVVFTDAPNASSRPAEQVEIQRTNSVSPALQKYQGLQLFVDGEAWGSPQRDTLWDLTNVFRGQHDITVAVVNNAGETITVSDPVRVYVHRPSTNFKNR